MMRGKSISKPGGVEALAPWINMLTHIELWSTVIKFKPLWKAESNKNAWIKSLKSIFKPSVSAVASECCEWVQVGIDVYTSHRKYQVNSQSCTWFSTVCVAVIIHRNHFFHLYQKDKSSESKVKFRQASNRCKGCWSCQTCIC